MQGSEHQRTPRIEKLKLRHREQGGWSSQGRAPERRESHERKLQKNAPLSNHLTDKFRHVMNYWKPEEEPLKRARGNNVQLPFEARNNAYSL